ncbi:MAG: ABC transporter permease [SAR324 cluster bacterium]|nr:ABC transporter permease [SAR324 cluster bacterium]
MIDQQDLAAQFGEKPEKPEKPWQATARMFYTNKAAVFGLIGFLIVILLGLFGPIIFGADPFDIAGKPLMEPQDANPLGTDYLGRDILSGVIYGARPTMIIAITATVCATVIGISIGAIAGFYGGKIDNFLMRFTEFFQVLPSLVFAMVIVAVFEPSFLIVVLAIGTTTWTPLARLARAEFLKIKEREFVLAARALGAQNIRLILRVILPNALPPLIIAITLRVGTTIIFEAALSFLGLTDPSIMTWGRMIGLSRDYFFEAWWTVTFPGLAILFTALFIALIGDGLNDAFNPKLRRR